MTRPDIEGLKALAEKAAPSLVRGPCVGVLSQILRDGFAVQHPQPLKKSDPEADAAFIAGAIKAVPDLISYIEELEAGREKDREALVAVCIADDHRPRGLGTPSDWIRNSHSPAIRIARSRLEDNK